MGDHVWTAFWQLEQSRQRDMGEPQAFTYGEIQAWSAMARHPLSPWDLGTIMEMDIARRGVLGELRSAGGSEADGKPAPIRTVSMSNASAVERLFDSFGTVIDC